MTKIEANLNQVKSLIQEFEVESDLVKKCHLYEKTCPLISQLIDDCAHKSLKEMADLQAVINKWTAAVDGFQNKIEENLSSVRQRAFGTAVPKKQELL